jgi:hypothetical protein
MQEIFDFCSDTPRKISIVISEGSQSAPKMQDKRQKKIQNTKGKKINS